MAKDKGKKKSWILKALDRVEAVGNRLPHPITIFFYLTIFVVILSGVGALLHWSATGEVYNSAAGVVEEQTIKVVSLFSVSGLQYMLTHAISNFTGYAPLGVTLVIMLGIGVAEGSGYLEGLIRKAVKITPEKIVTPMVVFIGVMSNIASNAGYVVFIPLAAMIFMAYKKHPIAGIAAGFAGVSGGYSANLLIGDVDPILAGFSTAAANTIDPGYTVTAVGNWFFMIVSTALITLVGTFVTEKIVIPRLGTWKNNGDGSLVVTENTITDKEEKALKTANFVLLGLIILLVAVCIPQNSFMRNPETGSLIDKSTLMNSVIPLFTLIFFVPSFVYGKISGQFKTDKEVCAALTKSVASVSSFVVLAFVASQFTSYFGYTKIGNIISLKGAEILQAMNVNVVVLVVVFAWFSGFTNLFMASASAKWAIFAPVFVPMFMKLGLSPELTQIAYRVGDSSTNIIAPVVAWIPYIIVTMKKYDKDSGIGTLVSSMLPYSFAFLIGWSVLLIIWIVFKIPLGPGAPVFYGI